MIRVLALAAFCCAPAAGQQASQIGRGDIQITVRATGTVVLHDIFRLKSSIEGRAEDIWTSTGVWAGPSQDLGILLNKEFAALLDNSGTTDKEILADRWKPVYQPARIRCPYDCYLLKSFARSKQWIRPQAVLFEAARLRMVGAISPQDAYLIKDGMTLEYWDVKNPAKHFYTPIANFVLDVQGQKVQPGGSFRLDAVMGPKHFFPPGTQWEGIIVPIKKTKVLLVPTPSLIRFADELYLPVKVSTGLTLTDWTEITAGIEERRRFLILDDARLGNAQRHKFEIDPAQVRARVEEESRRDLGPAAEPGPASPPPQPKRSEPLPDPDARLGEDPYAP